MVKKIIGLCLIFLVIVLSCIAIVRINGDDDNKGLTKITVAEVAHSVFYAPQYVAHGLGYFEEEGLDVEIVLTSGADNVMAAVLSGDADIGFSGSEATIYVYNGGEEDYVMTFAGLTQKDGSFLVSREKYDNFTLDDLRGKTVIGGRQGGMPEMTFEWALREHGIDPKKDLTIDTSVAFAAMEGAFIGGNGDFVTLFEPNATSVEKNGLGYVVAYIGELGGEVPYTAYNARRSYIMENKDVIEKFTRAINKGLQYVYSHTGEEVAEIVGKYFPDTSLSDMITIVNRYKEGESWKKNITISEDEWDHIQEIMKASSELDKYVEYDKLIFDEYFDDYE
ncbi:MAG: ABC transporter substrate-binding protein [Bacilli bacterium]|nr:ABC transporter substrate-binding protein [Bacilli bacterium]